MTTFDQRPPPPGTDISGKQPYPSGLLARIVRINFPKRFGVGKLYLVLSVFGGNDKFQEGPGGSVSAAPEPTITVTPIDSVIKLDEYKDPTANESQDGFGGCLTYIPSQTGVVGFAPWPGGCVLSTPIYGSWGTDATSAYRFVISGQFGYMFYLKQSINGSACAPQPTSVEVASQTVYCAGGGTLSQDYSVSVTTVPVNGYSNRSKETTYLFQIPAGNEIIAIDINNLIDTFSNIVDHVGSGQDGNGSIQDYVYSTARQQYTQLNQIWDIYGDGEPRLDYDDGFRLNMGQGSGPAANGTYFINVYQDTTTSQMDNYGTLYHPFRVRIEPVDQGFLPQELIPEQPPLQFASLP